MAADRNWVCEWKYAGRDFPGFTSGPLKREEDLANIKIPEKPSGYFAHYLEVIRQMTEAIGDRYHLSVSILGPFAVGCFLRGIQEALMDTMDKPIFMKQYMELCTDLSIYFGRHILAAGLKTPFLNEIFLTPSMVSPETYQEFIVPYDLRVQEALGPEHAPNSLSAFMGKPGDRESRKIGTMLYKAFFSGPDSIDELQKAISYSLPGFSVSGGRFRAGPGFEFRRGTYRLSASHP